MAAKRGKAQARRNGRNGGGEHGLPLWGWLVLAGVLVAVGVLVAPKLMHGKGGDGFFRPAPNPNAQPAPVTDDEAVADDKADANTARKPEADKPKGQTQYDFYKLLPGNEVPMSDAEVAATARAEAAAHAAAAQPAPGDTGDTDDAPAPAPARSDAASSAPAASAASAKAPAPIADATPDTAAPRANDTPYLLQAGAFGASGDAEALKAKIALLGLGARVESAQIDGKTVYRVRMGPYGSASELAEAKHKLAAGGLPAMAIRAK